MEEEATSQGVQKTLEAGEGEEMDSPLEPLEEKQPCQCVDFNPVRPILDFWLLERWDDKFVLF